MNPQPFDGKPSALIGASPGHIGSARMQYHFRQIGVALNLNMINKPEVLLGGINNAMDNDEIVDDQLLKILNDHIEAFCKHIKNHT